MPLPLFSYPTTIVWIDDDPLFLENAVQLLKKSNTIKFASPEKSIEFFHLYKPLLPRMNFMRGCIESDSYEMLNHMPVDLNVNALKELYTNNERNSEISVLVTDYNMPNINGIDLCRQLRTLPMKKILLTGAADHKQAVAAFNERLIDCFITKESQTLIEDILFHTTRLKQQYFIDCGRQLLNHLETDFPLPLSDPIFIDFFQEWCKQNEIQEYYLIDKYGNFLLVDKKGKKSYFIVHTDQTLNNFIETHKEDKEGIAFIREVELRNKIPFFGEGVESWELQPDKWPEYFYVSQVLEGQQKYYWTIAG